MSFVSNLKKTMQENGISIGLLATRSGIHYSTICRWLTKKGVKASPGAASRAAILSAVSGIRIADGKPPIKSVKKSKRKVRIFSGKRPEAMKFWETINKRPEELSMSPKQLVKKAGISRAALQDWVASCLGMKHDGPEWWNHIDNTSKQILQKELEISEEDKKKIDDLGVPKADKGYWDALLEKARKIYGLSLNYFASRLDLKVGELNYWIERDYQLTREMQIKVDALFESEHKALQIPHAEQRDDSKQPKPSACCHFAVHFYGKSKVKKNCGKDAVVFSNKGSFCAEHAGEVLDMLA